MSCCRPQILGVLLALCSTAYPQASQPAAKADYSQEAYVIEQLFTYVSFDNDGKETRRQITRVRVQTDAGVQGWGLLALPFSSATQTLEVDYVRVRKPDGSTITTPPDNIQDLDSEITRSAPFYSDLREKHIAIKGLAKGDILEYEVHWNPIKPLVAGQFWFAYNFDQAGISLEERVEVKVPENRAVRAKGPQSSQTVRTQDGSLIYTWTHSKLQNDKDSETEKLKEEAVRGLLPAPDVQISTFQSWDEVGRWYWDLQKDRIEPSPAIRAKAAELTKGMTDDLAKIQALYSFVSTQYRYIGISFGIGRYQPHSAEDVLGNNYGDCKDKYTLLASLLQASGITIYPALISSGRKFDSDLPSPAQFDHVIGYLPQGKVAVWLDTTTEVAPFGYLLPLLRDKPALVMHGGESAQLVNTTTNPPGMNSQHFKITGRLSDDGTLQAQVEDTARGDQEVFLRLAFRKTPQPQWKDLVQGISYALGYSGTVSDITASPVDAILDPFHFAYAYNRKDYPDWANHQFTVPGLPFYMPQLKDDAQNSLWLGSELESISESTVTLPENYSPTPPSNVNLVYDFAEYHASYRVDAGAVVAERRMLIKRREVSPKQFPDYRTFLKQVQADVNSYVQTTASSEFAESDQSPVASLANAVRRLPESDNSDANRAEVEARATIQKSGSAAAIGAFKRAVEIDPKFTRAWLQLAIVYLKTGQTEDSLNAMRGAVTADPKQVSPYKLYADLLTSLQRTEEAARACQDAVKIAPDDFDSNLCAATLLMQQKHYAEAIPYLQTVSRNAAHPDAQIQLGEAYLRDGQTEKGLATFQDVLKSHQEPTSFNNVGYFLADTNIHLDKALEYTRQAVDGQEKESQGIDLDKLSTNDLGSPTKIAMFWDSLGWAHFRLGQLQQAEDYLQAAWLLDYQGEVGDHLAQVYEREKRTEKAIHTYKLALSTTAGLRDGPTRDAISEHLNHLTGTITPSVMDMIGNNLSGELSNQRSTKLPRLIQGTAAAEFFLLFSPGQKIDDVHFISGSEQLKAASDALYDAPFKVAFPSGSAAHLLRRVIVSCSEVTGCMAVLIPPDSVHSIN